MSAGRDALPEVTNIDPETGSSAGGERVTVWGANLTGATAVAFDDVPATNVTVYSDRDVQCDTPAHEVGEVEVTVTSPLGTSLPGGSFTYEDVPPNLPGLPRVFTLLDSSELSADSPPVVFGTVASKVVVQVETSSAPAPSFDFSASLDGQRFSPVSPASSQGAWLVFDIAAVAISVSMAQNQGHTVVLVAALP
jgi:hypothetical protein